VAEESKNEIKSVKLIKGSRRLPPLGHPTNFVNEPFVEALRAFFAEQRAEILAAFDSDLAKAVTGRTKLRADDYMSSWFDMAKWNRILGERVEPFVRYTFMSGGERALRQVTMQREFDALNPRVAVALDKHRAGSIVGINDTTLKRLRHSLAEGIAEGETVTDLRGRLEGQYDSFDKYKAVMIARTETIWAWNEGAVQGWIQSGVVEKKQWLSSADMRTCDWCEEMDGKIIGIEATYFAKGDSMSLGGEPGHERKMDFTYEDVGHPPLHSQCRCSCIAIMEGI
jgi:SPP1 gp7 family putative phage head morphogenesis protein